MSTKQQDGPMSVQGSGLGFRVSHTSNFIINT